MTGKIGCLALLVFFCCFEFCCAAPFLESHAQEGHLDGPALDEIFDLAYLIDTRSRFEYDILHMKNAIHVPVATMVREDLERLRKRNPRRAIVFYCNGQSCSKSRIAFRQAERWGFRNIYHFRPGIRDWAKEHPEKVLYFGKILRHNSAGLARLFGPHQDNKNALSPGQFVTGSRQPEVLVVDIRDVSERDKYPINLPNLHHYPLDRLVKYLKSGSRRVAGRKLFVLDGGGSQASWLRFLFADQVDQDVVFLKGGARAWQEQGFDKSGKSTHRAAK